MNKTNIQLVIDKIKANPCDWNQAVWHCGTQHCFAGWAQILSGKAPNEDTVRQDARIFLDLSYIDARWAFNADRTITDFESLLSDGYNRDGYNRNGYNCYGYDRDGYNCYGYDRDGYDRDGYDRYGYDRDGLDKNNKPC